MHQSAAVIVIAMGLVFVLLLGEIDLSAGFTAGTLPVRIMGIAATQHGWPWYLAILACLATGAVIGTCIGLLVARLGIPSFVVTLAAFLGSAGRAAQAHRRGRHRSPIRDSTSCWRSTTTTCRSWLGWTLATRSSSALYAFVTPAARSTRAGPAACSRRRRYRRPGEDRRARGARPRRRPPYLSVERSRNPAVVSLKGVPAGRGAAARAAGRPELPAHPDRRSAGTSTPSAATPRRPAGPASTSRAVRLACFVHRLHPRRGRRHPARQPRQLDLADDRWRVHPAVRGGRGRDRRHQPVRRQGPDRRTRSSAASSSR
ncbi:MAG: hypothetical protein WKF47_12750 [Geodermatophilaceae bacterium]